MAARAPEDETAHGPVALLLPTDRHVELALAEQPGTRPRTLRGFLREALAVLAPDTPLASPATARLATALALEEAHAGGLARLPDEPTARVALADAMDRALGRLRRAGTPVAALRAIGSPRAERLANALADADRILVGRGLVDERAAGAAFARALETARDDEREAILPARAVVTGMAAFEADDVGALEALHAALAERGGGVAVMLPRLARAGLDEADDPVRAIADRLERRWASLAKPPALVFQPVDAAVPELVVDTKDDEGEARAVASVVLDAVARGVPPERIAIAVPDLDEAALDPLRDALDDARVPFAEPRGRPPGASPEARAALELLALASGPITRDALIAVLRAPGLHTGSWTEQSGELDAARRATDLAHRLRELPVGVDRTGQLFVEALALAVASRPHDAWMPRALARLLEATSSVAAARTRGEALRRVRALYDRLRLGQPSARELAAALRAELAGNGAIALRAAGEGSRALAAVREAIDALALAASALGAEDAPCDFETVAAEIERAALSASTARGGARRAAAVRIARPAELAGLEHDLVIVTRLSADAYADAGDTDALLDERLAAALPDPIRPAGHAERDAARRTELAWALAGARRVVLTRSMRGEDDLGPPHALVRAALDAGATRRIEPPSRVARTASIASARAAELVRLAAGASASGGVAARVAVERARTAFFLDPRTPPAEHTGVAACDERDREHLKSCVGGASAESPIAVTAIERAAGCAFAGFAQRVLRVRRLEDVAEAADPRERGTLLHRALRAAFEATVPLRATAPRERVLEAARIAAERALQLDGAASPLRREAHVQAVADAVRVVARALEAGDPLAFALGERRFGAGELPPWGALELAAAGEPSVFVEGQIDRVDRSTDGLSARVVDYKTGKVPDAKSRDRRAFQLPLYAEVVARATGAQRLEAIYLAIKAGAVKEAPGEGRDRASSADERQAKIDDARRIVLALWRGEVAPRPDDARLCARCDARDVCRRPDVAPLDDEPEAL